MSIIGFIQQNLDQALTLSLEHLFLVFLSLCIAMVTGIPTGIAITKNDALAKKVLEVANILMTVPSIALFGIMLPILAPYGLGLGKVPAVVALVLYSELPIIRNTYTAIRNVDSSLVDAGKGMGLTRWQLLKEVEIPLAVPVILAGLRTAAVMNIGIAAIAAYIGAGGLGVFIQQGISRSYEEMIITGALGVSILAILVDSGMALIERRLTSKGLKIEA
ncbi:ABC transporter permease [Desulfoluna spongiiphila]|uniref:Osmoprotectant transport system permease protein n=1 Tax=Desulfoluna spongiiphila TaxID=419481 RepID=A0A1G5EQR4_9BACT|nr:ABC transporter permease [Desulfoluna spongiiphila]SCY29111.1 osmoprotectant transport system permease protein [Desulfoluna spongiiphila]VVS91271.1 abc transporter type 1 transmembrane domain meti-like [Desulfoluna spongiiphila]